MPEFNIEISLTKVLNVEADNVSDAIEKVSQDFNDGMYDLWTYDRQITPYKAELPYAKVDRKAWIEFMDKQIGKAFAKHPKWKFPKDTKLDKDGNPIVTQEELDTCDGLIHSEELDISDESLHWIKPDTVEVHHTKGHPTSDIIGTFDKNGDLI